MEANLNWKIQKSLQKWQMKVLYFRERFDLVDSPSEYYIIVSFLALNMYSILTRCKFLELDK